MNPDEIEVGDPDESPTEDDMEVDVEDEQGELVLSEEDERSPNLVTVLLADPRGEEYLRKTAQRILDQIDDAKEGREEYCERVAKDLAVFAGDLPPKNFPFEHCANIHVPVAIENTLRIMAHLSAELFGDRRNFFGVQPLGPEDQIIAQILSAHGNWQLNNKIPGFWRQMERSLFAFIYMGDVTVHSHYDEYCRVNKHEVLTVDEFITPYSYTTTYSDYGDLPWYCRVLHKYEYELEQMRGTWEQVDVVLKKVTPTWDSEPEQKVARVMAELHNLEIPDGNGTTAPFKLYWWEGWLELPGSERQRFCKLIIDPDTRTVMLMTVLEEPNWQDKIRYEQQLAELQQYQSAQLALQQEMDFREQQNQDLQQQHFRSQELGDQQGQLTMVQAMTALSNAPLPPAPVPPSWMQEEGQMPEPPRMEPLRLFAHGVCIEPMAGNLGLGLGRILAPYNRMANTSMNQFTDSATLANAHSLIISDTLEFKDGDFRHGPGKVNRVVGGGPDLKNQIVNMDLPPGNPQLIELVDRIQSYGRQAAQSPEVMSGEPGKSGEPYQSIATRVELATKILGSFGRKFLPLAEQVLKNNAFLNSIYMPDEEIFYLSEHALAGYSELVPDPMTGQARVKVNRSMYERGYEVEFRADLRFTTQAQRVQEAMQVVQMGQTDPMLASNPFFRYYSLKKCFEAMGRSDLVKALGPPPPPPMMPMGMMPPGMQPGIPPQPGQAPPGPPNGSNGKTPPPAQKPQAPPQGPGLS